MLNEQEADKWLLVHGTVRSTVFRDRLEHAWIDLQDGRIYESREHKYYTREEYEELFHPRPVRTYTREQFSEALANGSGYWAFCFGEHFTEEQLHEMSAP
jgi:hypothetical protein